MASILGLPYPGGPNIEKIAREGNPKAICFPRSLIDKNSLDFSFSGLKTAVLYHVRGKKLNRPDSTHLTDQQRANIAASFQAAGVPITSGPRQWPYFFLEGGLTMPAMCPLSDRMKVLDFDPICRTPL